MQSIVRMVWASAARVVGRCAVVVITVVLPSVVSAQAARDVAPNSEEFFETRVRPILSGTCFRCHGDQRVAGELRVDSRAALLKGGESGPAIVPEKPDESLLVQAVRRAEDVSAMPPDKPLPAAAVADLAAWIKAGAKWPAKSARFEGTRHWAFHPPTPSPLPEVRDAAWCRTAADRFILAKIEAAGHRPAPAADKRVLLRRMSYDLTGLPPPADEVAAFVDDPSPDAAARAADRLLASPRYGEQWGRHWLDVVRYADTAGENTDRPLVHAWRYRNWVIGALNQDKSYAEFVGDQLAGDLRAASGPETEYADRIVATGYLAIARRFGHDITKDIHLTHDDVIDNLGKTFLGLTIGCARCHDHKYDPITARDYYGLYGIFASTRFSFPGCEPQQQPRDMVPLVSPAQMAAANQRVEAELAEIDGRIKQVTDEQSRRMRPLVERLAQRSRVLSQGEIDDGKSAELQAGAKAPLADVSISAGETLLLYVSPRGNHGADSTLIDLQIAEVGGAARVWKTADLVDSLLEGNPHPDKYGHAAVWSFLDARESLVLMPQSVAQISGRAELQAWRNGETPSVYVNKSTETVRVWTPLAPRQFFVHPGANGPVAVAWQSPITGKVAIQGRIADVHPGGPDGVGWRLEHVAAPLADELRPLAGGARVLADLQRLREAIVARRPTVPVAYAVADAKPQNARIQRRGEPTDLGDEVPRKFLDVLGGQQVQPHAGSGRAELAAWISDAANPLSARVMVNRLWQWHFGRGIVKTPNDFGSRGAAPTHRELLDHLALEFVRDGGSFKAMHRRIIGSATYQQAAVNRDPDDLYASFVRRRLSAEELRDTLLALGGRLDLRPGGAHPFPDEKTWSFSQHAPFAAEYDTAARSVYVMQKRNRRTPFFALFDGADPNATTPVRDATTVPTQALFFVNDPFLHSQAEAFSRRIVAAAGDDRARLDFAFRQMFGRDATPAELAEAEEFLTEYAVLLADQPADARPAQAWAAYARVLLGSNEVIHVD